MNFNCPHCNQLLTDDASKAGRAVACPSCRRSLRIPLEFHCPRCGQLLVDDVSRGGNPVICPACGGSLRVPMPAHPQPAVPLPVQAVNPSLPAAAEFGVPVQSRRLAGQKPAKQGTSTATIVVVALGLLVGLSCLMMCGGLFSDRSGARSGAAVGGSVVSLGDSFRFKEDVFAGRTENALDRITQLSVAKDNAGLGQMMVQGRLLIITGGTEAKLIDRGIFHSEVRLMSGPSSGSSVWVASDFVQ